MTRNIYGSIARATLICGVLDILSAFFFAGLAGGQPGGVLRMVASGPFGNGMREAGTIGAAIGLLVHFAIMAVMATAFMVLAARLPAIVARPWIAGILYGLALYVVMYWIVLPLRWPGNFPQMGLRSVATAIFAHVTCVGIPMGLIAARALVAGQTSIS